MTPTQERVVAALRSPPPAEWPADTRNTVRARLEHAVADAAAARPVKVTKRDVIMVGGCEARWMAERSRRGMGWNEALAAGTLLHAAIRASIWHPAGRPPTEVAAHHGITAARRDDPTLAGWLDRLGPADRDRMTAGVVWDVAAWEALVPHPPRSWRAMTETWMTVEAGLLTMPARVDAAFGAVGRRVLVDWKAGRARPVDAAGTRHYVLHETLRTGVPPLAVAVIGVRSGDVLVEPVTPATLDAALTAVGEAVRRAVGLCEDGEAPMYRPGTGCVFCPVRAGCPAAAPTERREE